MSAEKDKATLIGERTLDRKREREHLACLRVRARKMRDRLREAGQVLDAAVEEKRFGYIPAENMPPWDDVESLVKEMHGTIRKISEATNDLRRMGIDD